MIISRLPIWTQILYHHEKKEQTSSENRTVSPKECLRNSRSLPTKPVTVHKTKRTGIPDTGRSRKVLRQEKGTKGWNSIIRCHFCPSRQSRKPSKYSSFHSKIAKYHGYAFPISRSLEKCKQNRQQEVIPSQENRVKNEFARWGEKKK